MSIVNVSSRKVGMPDAFQQPIEYGRRTDGRYTIVPYESTNPANIDIIALQAENLGLQYEVRNTFGKSRIDVHYNWNWTNDPATEIIERWEAVPLKVEKSILDTSNPLTRQLLATPSGIGELTLIKQSNEQGTIDDWVVRQSDGTVFFIGPPNVSSNAAMLLAKYYFDGQRTQPIAVPVLKHVRIVNSNFISPETIPTVPTLYSTPALIADFNIPNSILVTVPDNDTALVQANLTGTSINQTFGYGWLRSAPELSQVSMFKWNMQEQFEYGLWGLDIFGGRLHDV